MLARDAPSHNGSSGQGDKRSRPEPGAVHQTTIEELPQHLRSATFIQAWRNPLSLGRTLIPFTLFDKLDPPVAPLTPAL